MGKYSWEMYEVYDTSTFELNITTTLLLDV